MHGVRSIKQLVGKGLVVIVSACGGNLTSVGPVQNYVMSVVNIVGYGYLPCQKLNRAAGFLGEYLAAVFCRLVKCPAYKVVALFRIRRQRLGIICLITQLRVTDHIIVIVLVIAAGHLGYITAAVVTHPVLVAVGVSCAGCDIVLIAVVALLISVGICMIGARSFLYLSS